MYGTYPFANFNNNSAEPPLKLACIPHNILREIWGVIFFIHALIPVNLYL